MTGGSNPQMTGDASTPEELYLDLMKKCLTRYIFGAQYESYDAPKGSFHRFLYAPLRYWMASRQLQLVRAVPLDSKRRAEGRDWPHDAETMIGLKRLDNIQKCIANVLEQQVPGDLIETGVWRGGASIFMRAVLKAYGDTKRIVWVADSFRGLPPPDPARYPADAGDWLWSAPQLAISQDEVKANFKKYRLLDGQVHFLEGWFRDTLPNIPAERFSILRLDGDMYESTTDGLRHLYPKLSVGGYVIIDDYGAVPACKAAVEDFRREHDITEKLESIDWTGAFWQRLE